MKKIIILTACLFLFSVSVFSQTVPNYSGEWALDKNISKLPQRMANIESMTITITQSGQELQLVTLSTRKTVPQTAGSEERITYSLSGNEIKANIGSGNISGTVKSRASFEGGKLNLKAERNIKTQGGDYAATTRETWELSPDGATLKIKRETQTPQDTMTAEMVFTKKTR